MSNPFIVPDKDGKPVFIGREDPNNPPVSPPGGATMTCPVCHREFDYLLGEDANGGRMGCEQDWRPPTTPTPHTNEPYDTGQNVPFD